MTPGWAQRKELQWDISTARDARNASAALWYLSRVGYLKAQLSVPTKEKCIRLIGRAIANCRSDRAGKSLLDILLDMNLSWEDLPAAVKLNCMIYFTMSLRFYGQAGLLPTFSHIRAIKGQWSLIPYRPRNILAMELAQLASQNVEAARQVIGGLYVIGASWLTLPKEARNMLLDGLLLGTVEENAKAYVLVERMKARIIPSKETVKA